MSKQSTPFGSHSSRFILLLVATLVFTSAVAPVAAVAASTTDAPTPQPSVDGGAGTMTVVAAQANNSTATPNGSQDGLGVAQQTRISPVKMGEEYARVSARDEADAYSVIGPNAIFSASNDVAAAEIKQPGASAQVKDGSRTIAVNFASDASPGDEYSLYTLTLYFSDDSQKSLDLYVRRTNQFVAPASLQELDGLRQNICTDAKNAGYEECTAENLEEYYNSVYDTAQILSNFLSPELQAAFVAIIAIAQSGLLLVIFAIIGMAGAFYIIKYHGDNIKKKVHDTHNAYVQKRRDFQMFYKEQREHAAEEPLSEIDEIGASDTALRDGFGYSTVKDFADDLAFGEPKRTPENTFRRRATDGGEPADGGSAAPGDGNGFPDDIEMAHEGIHELEHSDSLLQEWPGEGIQRTPLTQTEFLVYGMLSLKRMAHHYGQQEYVDAYEKTRAKVQEFTNGNRRYDRGGS